TSIQLELEQQQQQQQQQFVEPRREILTKEDLENFKQSAAFKELIEFVRELSESVVGKKLTDPIEPTP
ncbi:hypothetical protein EV182_005060, partial [Spiromyces aspiralis]